MSCGQVDNPHLTTYVWGCSAEANPSIGKLDSKTYNCYFIDYPEKSKDYRFYCPDRHTKFVETRHVVFWEEELIRESMVRGSMVA
jgi:hypothetical protein